MNPEKKEESAYQSYHITIFRMSSFQQKIKRHSKKKEIVAHSYGGKKKLTNCHWRNIGLTRQ